jgi:hypothetical protein
MEKEMTKSEALAIISSKLKIKDLRDMAESPTGERFTIDEYGRIFFGVTGDKVKFWEDNDYSLLDLELEEVQHFCDTVVLARDVLVKYPGFDGAMMLAKLGVLDVFSND